jgi:hypothetical protein
MSSLSSQEDTQDKILSVGQDENSSSQWRIGKCGHSKSILDPHFVCVACSRCSLQKTCDLCSGWDFITDNRKSKKRSPEPSHSPHKKIRSLVSVKEKGGGGHLTFSGPALTNQGRFGA